MSLLLVSFYLIVNLCPVTLNDGCVTNLLSNFLKM